MLQCMNQKSSQSNAVVRTCHAEEGQSTLEGPFYVEEDPQGRRLQRWLKQIEKLNCHAEKRNVTKNTDYTTVD